MANATLTKGSVVEVCSDDPGFLGAWYVATFIKEVEDLPTQKRASNKKIRGEKKIRYLVEYDTLLKDDGEPLMETVDPSFVRPSPPPYVRRNNDDNEEEAEVVVEEGDGGGDFELYDVVDAYHRDGWWIGVVKSVIVDDDMRKYIVSFEEPPEEFEFESSKLRLHVDWIDCRWLIPPKKTPGFTTPSKGSQKTNVGNETVGTSSSAKKNSRSRGRALAGSNGKEMVVVPVLETSRSDDSHQDSPPVEHTIIITQNHASEDDTLNQKRWRLRSSKLVAKKPIGLVQDGHGVTTNIDELPLSVWYQGMHQSSAFKRSSYFSPLDQHGNSLNQAVATSARTTITTTTNYQEDWPFIKRSPVWATIESLELFLAPPQKPHFSPLKKIKEDYREGLAIAHMVTFGNLVHNILGLRPNDPVDIINNSLETLSDMETHGFDVGLIRGRLNKLLSLKSKACQHQDKRKEVEKELEKCNHEKSLVVKEMDELKVKMQVLKEKTEQTATIMEVKEEEFIRLQSNLHLVSNQINDLLLAFEELAATPL